MADSLRAVAEDVCDITCLHVASDFAMCVSGLGPPQFLCPLIADFDAVIVVDWRDFAANYGVYVACKFYRAV